MSGAQWSHRAGEVAHPLAIVKRLMNGEPGVEIARAIGVTENQVKQTLYRMYVSLGVHDEVELVNLFLLHWDHPLSASHKYLGAPETHAPASAE